MPNDRPPADLLRTGISALDRTLFALTLILTTALSLTLSANRLMWNDEFLSFYSDSVPTARQVVEVQLHHPISLDPPAYHLLSHFAMDIFGPSAMALRLPALAGFLLMELSLFALVRRLASARSAVIAMLFPLLTASFSYSFEGRPYGLLLGLYASAFVCWFLATRSERLRVPALVGLTMSIALAITSHYFGILVLLPVVAAELARIRERRRFDWGVAAAIVLGFAAVGIILPFGRALAPYRTHYYMGTVSAHAVTQGYRELFIRYSAWPTPVQKLTALFMAVATLTLAVTALRRFRARPAGESASVWVGLVALALLPFFGFLFGRFVTHTMEVRYVIAALLAFAVALGLVLEQKLANKALYLGLYTAMVLVALTTNVAAIHALRGETRGMLASLVPSPAMAAALAANPNARIYTQSLGNFYLDSYYAPDAALRSRFALIYDGPREVMWLKHNTNAVTAVNMSYFTSLSMVPYSDFAAQPGALFMDYDSGWEWAKHDLEANHVALQPLGPSMGGNLYRLPAPQ